MHDCLIVGAGVIGLSTAWELAGRGLSVCVIDRGEVGKEASWAGAGILPPANLAGAVDPIDRLRGWSHKLHPRWAARLREETGVDTGYRACGGVYLARSAGEAAALAGARSSYAAMQIAFERLSPRVLAQLEPTLEPIAESGSLRAAYHAPGEAQLRNPDHLRALAIACRRLGVEIRSGVEARGFKIEGDRLSGVETSDGLFQAERYVLTAGAWTAGLLDQLNVSLDILPIRGQMVMFRCPQPPLRRIVNEGPRYLTPRDDGRLLAGSTQEEVGFDKRTTEAGIAGLLRFARDLVPELENAPIERTWAGLRPASYDGHPYIGPLPNFQNALVAAGHFRSGLHLSPATAVLVSRLVRGVDPEFDLSPFRPSRG